VAKCLAFVHPDDDSDTPKNVSVGLCDTVRPRTQESIAMNRDAFALAARALTDVYGPPHSAEAGERASMMWRLGDASLFLDLGTSTPRLAMRRTADYDRLVEMSEQEQ
jgi:hypothetical protein